MKLRKDDPLYYKLKINGLILEAFENGLKVEARITDSKVSLLFKSDNGDVAESPLNFNNNQ